MQDNPELDWLDRTTRGVDALLEPRGVLVLAGCVLGTHLLLLVLIAGRWGLPTLDGFVGDVIWDLVPGLDAAAAQALARLVTGCVAAGLGGAAMGSTRLAGAGRAGRVVLALFFLLPWSLHVAWPMVVARQLGMPGTLWTAGGFLLGFLVVWGVEELRA